MSEDEGYNTPRSSGYISPRNFNRVFTDPPEFNPVTGQPIRNQNIAGGVLSDEERQPQYRDDRVFSPDEERYNYIRKGEDAQRSHTPRVTIPNNYTPSILDRLGFYQRQIFLCRVVILME